MLSARWHVPLLDYFGVPYTVDESADVALDNALLEQVSWIEDGKARRALAWPVEQVRPPAGVYRIGSSTIFAGVRAEAVSPGRESLLNVFDSRGEPRAAVYRDDDGSIHLPFDPNEAVANVLSEQYREL